MTEEEALRSTLRTIVAEEMPHSLETFDIEGDAAISEAMAGRSGAATDRQAHAGFGETDIQLASELIKLIAATVSLVMAIHKGLKGRKEATSPQDLQLQWYERLREAGLPEDQARRICTRFSGDVERLLRDK
jgi:hypothetical protein